MPVPRQRRQATGIAFALPGPRGTLAARRMPGEPQRGCGWVAVAPLLVVSLAATLGVPLVALGVVVVRVAMDAGWRQVKLPSLPVPCPAREAPRPPANVVAAGWVPSSRTSVDRYRTGRFRCAFLGVPAPWALAVRAAVSAIFACHTPTLPHP